MKIRYVLSIVLLALVSFSASATDRYFSDCQAGADVSCVAGSDTTGAGTAANPWQTTAKLTTQLVPGDRVFFASGGSWIYTGLWNLPWNSGGNKNNPIIIAPYTASWCSGACLTEKPILTNTTLNSSGLQLTVGGAPTHREGITITGLKFVGTMDSTTDGSGGNGIFIFNDIDWVTIDNVEITGYKAGIYMAGSSGTPNPGSDGINSFITIKNSYFHDNAGFGILGGADYLLIENNTFTDNGSANVFDHNTYLAGSSVRPMNHLIYRGNHLSGAARLGSDPHGAKGVCSGVEMNFHGLNHDGVIENNVIDDTGMASGACYGISITPITDEAESTNFAIRGNKIINIGNVGIDIDTCVVCTIENNLIVWTDTIVPTQRGINLPDTVGQIIANDQDTIRNNSIYLNSGSSLSNGIRVEMFGTHHRVVSNLVVFDASVSAGGHECYIQMDISAFDVWDYNLCYDPTGNYQYSRTFQPTAGPKYSTLAAAQAAGFDIHGSQANPLLVATPSIGNGYSMAVQSGSPVINAGHPSLSSRLAYPQSSVPVGARDIGAYDYGASGPVTPSPTMVGQ